MEFPSQITFISGQFKVVISNSLSPCEQQWFADSQTKFLFFRQVELNQIKDLGYISEEKEIHLCVKFYRHPSLTPHETHCKPELLVYLLPYSTQVHTYKTYVHLQKRIMLPLPAIQ